MQNRKTNTAPDRFSPVEVGPLTLKNRIVMAPLTRSRAGPGNVPKSLRPARDTQTKPRPGRTVH
jgi:N-ethylmaleimide reductase